MVGNDKGLEVGGGGFREVFRINVFVCGAVRGEGLVRLRLSSLRLGCFF